MIIWALSYLSSRAASRNALSSWDALNSWDLRDGESGGSGPIYCFILLLIVHWPIAIEGFPEDMILREVIPKIGVVNHKWMNLPFPPLRMGGLDVTL